MQEQSARQGKKRMKKSQALVPGEYRVWMIHRSNYSPKMADSPYQEKKAKQTSVVSHLPAPRTHRSWRYFIRLNNPVKDLVRSVQSDHHVKASLFKISLSLHWPTEMLQLQKGPVNSRHPRTCETTQQQQCIPILCPPSRSCPNEVWAISRSCQGPPSSTAQLSWPGQPPGCSQLYFGGISPALFKSVRTVTLITTYPHNHQTIKDWSWDMNAVVHTSQYEAFWELRIARAPLWGGGSHRRSLEHLSYEDGLRELSMFILEKASGRPHCILPKQSL